MDSLPVELLHLIFQYCDHASVKSLRLVSATLADVGYDYLLSPHFTWEPWRDDLDRLLCIAGHERLRGKISTLTFNFARIDARQARHAPYFHYWLQEPQERGSVLRQAWLKYRAMEERERDMPPFASQAHLVEDCFRGLPNLRELEVTHTKCPAGMEALRDLFVPPTQNCGGGGGGGGGGGRNDDRAQVCRNMNAIVAAARHARLASLSLDPLPLELFKAASDRRHWFDCARYAFPSLTRLALVLDPPAAMLPQARFRAVNGLGRVLQFAPNLTHLSLAFRSYHRHVQQRPPPAAAAAAIATEKFAVSFAALLGGEFRFEKLTDLKLDGVSCAEGDLLRFLVRHAPTLERLRLGGRGLAKPQECSRGGIALHEGTFRSLFTHLQGKLPRLERFHMEGDFEAGDVLTGSRERYKFRPVSDDDWEAIGDLASSPWSIDCLELERYLVEGGPFPKLVLPAN